MTSGEAFAVAVEVQDAGGERVDGEAIEVQLSLQGPGTLSGATTALSQDGTASFQDLRIDVAALGYTLVATATELQSATSHVFEVLPGPGTQLAFTHAPAEAVAGSPLNPHPRVELLDEAGNRVREAHTVQLVLEQRPDGASLHGATSVLSVDGVAQFPDVFLDKAGTASLRAMAPGFRFADSESFSVRAGAPVGLAFLDQPTSAASGASLGTIRVQAVDAWGNLAPTASGSVHLELASGPSNAKIQGAASATFVEGVATFTSVAVDKAAQGYTLRATSGSLTPALSTTFDVSPGAPTQLAFLEAIPDAVATDFLRTVRVELRDAAGNRAPVDGKSVSVALSGNPAGGVLDGTSTATTSQGVATFSNLKIAKAGSGYALRASSDGNSVESNTFSVLPGAATALHFRVQPTDGRAGVRLAPFQVEVQDSEGNRVTDSQATIQIANSPATALEGTRSITASQGLATFSDLAILLASPDPYAFVAKSPGLTDARSHDFFITAGPPTHLAFTGSFPTEGRILDPIGASVSLKDAHGNTVHDAEGMVHLELRGGDPTAEAAGLMSKPLENGSALFQVVIGGKAAPDYYFVAQSAGFEEVRSPTFALHPHDPNRLAILDAPTGVRAGATFPLRVAVQDYFGNDLTTDGVQVALSLGSAPEGGALGGTLVATTTAGIATFDDLRIEKAGAGYTLRATATDLQEAESPPLVVEAADADQLAFRTQPHDLRAGERLQPLQVEVQDSWGNRVPGAQITLTLALLGGEGVLVGERQLTTSGGLATFTDLSLPIAGTYRLHVSGGGLEAESVDFEVRPGPVTKLAFASLPIDAVVDRILEPPVVVELQDDHGNLVTDATGAVQVDLGHRPNDASLEGTRSVDAIGGRAVFTDLRIDRVCGPYTLVANSHLYGSAESNVFSVSAVPPAALAFGATPSTGVAGEILPAIQVFLLDDDAQVATGSNAEVTLSLGDGGPPAVLHGTLTVRAVGGVATFDDLYLEASGTYSLVATSGDLDADESDPLTIEAAEPAALAWLVTPTGARSEENFGPAVVEVLDDFGNRVDWVAGDLEVEITSGPADGTLSGDTRVAIDQGLATFATLSIDKVGSYQLAVEGIGLPPVAASTPVTITAGEPTSLRFIASPVDPVESLSPFAVSVELRDNAGNLAVGASGDVTLSVHSGPGGVALRGTVSLPASGGQIDFADLTLDLAGTTTLQASYGGLQAESDPIEVVAGPVAKVVLATGLMARSGKDFTVIVSLYDAGGNLAGDASTYVTLDLYEKPGDGELTGTLVMSGSTMYFTDLRIDKAGKGYRIRATHGDLYPISDPIEVVAGDPMALVFLTEPMDGEVDEVLAPAPQVGIVDAAGNLTYGSNQVTLELRGGSATATLDGTIAREADVGVATFDDLTIDEEGSGYYFVASAEGLTDAQSATFDITAPFRVEPQLSSRDVHVCFLQRDGTVKCWGENGQQQLGVPGNDTALIPVPVQDPDDPSGFLSEVVQIAAGGGGPNATRSAHTCALKADQTLRCWGSNDFGQLGDGTTTGRWQPKPVLDFDGDEPLQGVVEVSVGKAHSCARLSDGTMACWGSNANNRIDGGGTPKLFPVRIEDPDNPGSPLGGIIQVSLGEEYTCALLQDRTARCWGPSGNFRTGLGRTGNVSVPTPVVDQSLDLGLSPLQSIASLAAGRTTGCALLTDGRVRCWGYRSQYAVGDGSKDGNAEWAHPVLESAGVELSGIIQVDTGHTQSCALRSAGGVVCWGWNSNGRLGVNDSLALGSQYPRTGLTGPGRPVAGAVQVTTGNAHSCVLLETDEVLCAGRREEVGSNPPGNLLVFTPVSL